MKDFRQIIQRCPPLRSTNESLIQVRSRSDSSVSLEDFAEGDIATVDWSRSAGLLPGQWVARTYEAPEERRLLVVVDDGVSVRRSEPVLQSSLVLAAAITSSWRAGGAYAQMLPLLGVANGASSIEDPADVAMRLLHRTPPQRAPAWPAAGQVDNSEFHESMLISTPYTTLAEMQDLCRTSLKLHETLRIVLMVRSPELERLPTYASDENGTRYFVGQHKQCIDNWMERCVSVIGESISRTSICIVSVGDEGWLDDLPSSLIEISGAKRA